MADDRQLTGGEQAPDVSPEFCDRLLPNLHSQKVWYLQQWRARATPVRPPTLIRCANENLISTGASAAGPFQAVTGNKIMGLISSDLARFVGHCSAALTMAADTSRRGATAWKKPNIIVIMGDDIGMWKSAPTIAA